MRNMNKFMVLYEIREMAAVAAKCRDPVRRKLLRKSVVTKLWVNGRASEDRDEWTKEVRTHCEKCYGDTLQRCRPKGSVTREIVETVWLPSKADGYGSQSTGFSARGEK